MIPEHLRAEYDRYISSSEWKKRRFCAIDRKFNTDKRKGTCEGQNYECDSCGWNFKKCELEVHHKHYRNFKMEKDEDLLVVCYVCHKNLDKKREKEGKKRSADALFDAQLEGWAEKVFGEYWYEDYNIDYIYDMFMNWKQKKEGWG